MCLPHDRFVFFGDCEKNSAQRRVSYHVLIGDEKSVLCLLPYDTEEKASTYAHMTIYVGGLNANHGKQQLLGDGGYLHSCPV